MDAEKVVTLVRNSTFRLFFIGCDVTRVVITKHSSALYIGMAKVLPIIDVLGYDGQNSSFSSRSDSTPITQEGSHIST